jgi:translation initiation factor 1
MARKKDHVALGDTQSLGNNPFASLLEGVSASSEGEEGSPRELVDTVNSEWSLAAVDRAVVRMERKGHGGKTITVLAGLSAPPDSLEALCKRLRKHFGCGARIVDEDVVLQGDLRDRLRDWLLAEGVRRVV